MEAKERPTAQDVVDGIVAAFLQSREPLDVDLFLGPTVFDVFLHPSALEDLHPVFRRLESQAKIRLNNELQAQNRTSSQRSGPVATFFRFLKILFFGLSGSRRWVSRAGQTEVRGDWKLTFNATADAHNDLRFLAIDAGFETQGTVGAGGLRTVPLKRRTVLAKGRKFETTRPDTYQPLRDKQKVTERVPLAKLSYEDESGPGSYLMLNREISVGRRDEDSRADLCLNVVPDVSRKHILIRQISSDEFQVKDVSKFGITVDGQAVGSDDWVPLPRRAWIGLAGIVDIKFEAIP